MLTSILLLLVSAPFFAAAVNWNGNNWAHACDFRNNDMSNANVPGSQCGGTCAATSGCTHFTWTTSNGGTCWMKRGPVSKSDAFDTGDQSMVCGVTGASPPGNGVLTTFHGATEAGACMLPQASYSTPYPLALGNIAALGNLKYTNAMCGHILEVNCGNGPLNIIVSNSNLGGGLDLYTSSWNKATNNASPGEKFCSVRMTSLNPFTSGGARCYYAPNSDMDNSYYRLLGVFNTADRIVSSASLGGISGSFNGVQPYFAFNGFAPSNSGVIFRFTDGSSQQFNLGDCVKWSGAQIWR